MNVTTIMPLIMMIIVTIICVIIVAFTTRDNELLLKEVATLRIENRMVRFELSECQFEAKVNSNK